ncbi:MAG: sulfate adenylyltransferase, partial [Chloroflexi bacterium]|nr:sulfate adenylyltransferase [Chloroflexota bacterium]
FAEFDPYELGITPLFFEHAFWCRACNGMATTKTCPHEPSTRTFLSGTAVRDLLRANQALPVEFTRPEVAHELVAAYRRD